MVIFTDRRNIRFWSQKLVKNVLFVAIVLLALYSLCNSEIGPGVLAGQRLKEGGIRNPISFENCCAPQPENFILCVNTTLGSGCNYLADFNDFSS